MASVRQKNGKWYYRITLTVGDGSHKYIERGSWKSKKEAQEAGNKAELLFKYGEVDVRRKNLSFHFLSEEWFEYAKKKFKNKSLIVYAEINRNYIYPKFKDYNISAITPRMCQSIIDDGINKRLSNSRLSHMRGLMNNIFNYAVNQGYIKESPSRNVILPSKQTLVAQTLSCRSGNKIVSKELLEALFKRFPEDHPYYIPLILGYRCGLRIGEVFGLFIEDFDSRNKILHIRRQIEYDEKCKLYFTNPKYSSFRDIELDNETCRFLNRHVELLLNGSLHPHFKRYYISKSGYLSQNEGNEIHPLLMNIKTGRMMNPSNMMYVAKVVHGKLSKIDVIDQDWCFHNLRHTHASDCLAAGMSPVSVQKRLGHSNLKTTFNTYIHETETQVTESRDIINKLYK